VDAAAGHAPTGHRTSGTGFSRLCTGVAHKLGMAALELPGVGKQLWRMAAHIHVAACTLPVAQERWWSRVDRLRGKPGNCNAVTCSAPPPHTPHHLYPAGAGSWGNTRGGAAAPASDTGSGCQRTKRRCQLHAAIRFKFAGSAVRRRYWHCSSAVRRRRTVAAAYR